MFRYRTTRIIVLGFSMYIVQIPDYKNYSARVFYVYCLGAGLQELQCQGSLCIMFRYRTTRIIVLGFSMYNVQVPDCKDCSARVLYVYCLGTGLQGLQCQGSLCILFRYRTTRVIVLGFSMNIVQIPDYKNYSARLLYVYCIMFRYRTTRIIVLGFSMYIVQVPD